MPVTTETLTGAAIAGVVDDIARLRIEVFRDWPYLYEGDAAYEANYLGKWSAIEGAAAVVARDGVPIVGASTCAPLVGEMDAFRRPFQDAGWNIGQICYFGESILEPAWRGQGIGHRFFDGREAHARNIGSKYATFCAVTRPHDHPMRPAGYRPLDAFWKGRGYEKVTGLTCTFPWKDIGDAEMTEKPMQFWMRAL